MSLTTLEPKAIWKHFAAINAIPRASKKEDQIIEFMINFGQSLGLETERDHMGNVLIRKPAMPGFESKKTLVLQSHLDMVHQKNNDTHFDFAREGINMFVDGDWVKANGTTLGADNGIGVACMMSVLAATDINHPAIEALFTIDEETGMTGAKELSSGWLKGDFMLNLDTEEDHEITIGCAGGMDITATGMPSLQTIDPTFAFPVRIEVKGLRGGHSGMDIDKGLANANKLLIRILYALHDHIAIHRIDGGGLRNAIPREAKAEIFCTDLEAVSTVFDKIKTDIMSEYGTLEPNIDIQFYTIEIAEGEVLERTFQGKLIAALHAVHDGVFRMSPAIAGLVETSNNLARVFVDNEKFQIMCLTRSSAESSKRNLAVSIRSVFELLGAQVEFAGDYPGWQPEAEGELVRIARKCYTTLFDEEPHVNACHAGLECGLIGEKYPVMKMVSIGPTILGAHSPDERVSISSVQKFWKYLLALLEETP